MLIIPMSGYGRRFVNAGYKTLKPLIKVDGRPVVAHVLDMYPQEIAPIFICNKEHLETTEIKKIILELRPQAVILAVNPGDKKGPVIDIMKVAHYIPDDEDVLISYCDFTGIWNYKDFKQTVKNLDVDGAIPSYKGFHPHILGPNYYGHMRWDENNLMLEMKEKASFTDNKMDEYAAAGNYWFKTGALMKRYFAKAIEKGMKTGEEYFCSMPYNLLVRDGLRVYIYELEHFCQWGTPEDLEEYEAWSRTFAKLSKKGDKKGITEIPPNREQFVKFRDTTDENLKLTYNYWKSFFSKVDWHPFSKDV